jgi:hypothetical protein
MLAQTETKSKASLGGSNGSDPQQAKLKKELSLALREISNLKNKLNQAKENIAKERAGRSSKSRKDGSPDAEVGGKRSRQHAKRAKASRQATSSPSPPRKGFRIFQLVTTVTRRRKRIIQNRTQEQPTQRQILLAFNHLSRRRLHNWRWSPDL